MSDEAQTVNETPTATANTGIGYEVIPFRAKGDAEGFSFTTKIYGSANAVVADIGEDALLSLVNSEVQARLGMKARSVAGFSALIAVEAPNRLQVKNNLIQTLTTKFPSKVIFSEADALAWKPDVRELSLAGIQKKIYEAYKNNDMAQFNLWIDQLKAAAARQAERAQAGL
jgi:hypothetical protein